MNQKKNLHTLFLIYFHFFSCEEGCHRLSNKISPTMSFFFFFDKLLEISVVFLGSVDTVVQSPLSKKFTHFFFA